MAAQKNNTDAMYIIRCCLFAGSVDTIIITGVLYQPDGRSGGGPGLGGSRHINDQDQQGYQPMLLINFTGSKQCQVVFSEKWWTCSKIKQKYVHSTVKRPFV